MKIALITPYYYPKIGGLENYARQLALALREQYAAEIVIISSGERRTVVETVDGMKIYRLATPGKLSNTPVNPAWPVMIRRIFAEEKPDIIHAHSPVPSMADTAALAAGKIPFVLFYHAATLRKDASLVMRIATRVYETLQSVTFARATRIAAVSEFVREQLPEKFRAKTIVVPNSISETDIMIRRQPDAAPFIFISSLARTHAWKGLDELLEAMAIYVRDYDQTGELIVIGDGDDRERYESKARELGIEQNVLFHGAQVGDTKDRLLASSLALISYPSSPNDAFPTVFLEAWARSVPVIAGAIGPIPSLVSDARTGYLVPPHQPEKLASVMHKVASDYASRQQVANEAREQTERRYTWRRQAKHVYEISQELL